MSPPEESNEGIRTAAAVIGVFCAVIGTFVLSCWLSGGTGAEVVADRMKANTALAFTLIGAALVLRLGRRVPRLADVLAALAAGIGALTLLEYATAVDLGIDELVQREHSALAEAVLHPNRMAPNTALALTLAGLSIFASRRGRTAVLLSQAFSIGVFLTGFSAIVGYLYDATLLYQPTSYIRMAGLTAMLATAIGVAALFQRPELGLGQAFTRRDAGGYMLRRAIPMVLGLPVAVGYLRLGLQSLGVVDTPTGTALLVVCLTVVSAAMAVMLARSVSVADAMRRASEQRLEAVARLNAALARASGVDEVLRAVVHEGAEAVGASAANVFLPSPDGTSLDVRGSMGHSAPTVAHYQRMRSDAATPAADAWRTRQPVVLESREQLFQRYPTVSPEHVRHSALAALPMLGRDGPLGVLGVSFSEPRRLSGQELEQLSVLAWHCAQALERALLLDSERKLREAAESNMAELRAAQEAAVAANQTKDEFLAMLGHELRNPLAPIVIALEVLDRKKEPALLRERKIIYRQVKHLMRMVDDLLDVSRIARGKIELNRTRVELHGIVTKAVEMASPLFEQKRHQLLIDVPERGLVLFGDEHRLTQAVSNLLTNAARYTDDGGHVEVRAAAHDGRVVLTVKDDGDGIAPEQLPRLFEAFAQAPTEQRSSAGGLGLGLALVKRFAEMHQGTAKAESAGLKQGSTFTLELPLATGAQLQPRPSAPRPPRTDDQRRRVLVVDDNVDAAELLAEGLRADGHDVRVANDGPHAIDLAEGLKPEIAFLDLGLPAMDGYEVAARLRELDQRVVLVAVTGYGQASDKARTAAAGFQHHLVKPVDLETTLGIARHLRA